MRALTAGMSCCAEARGSVASCCWSLAARNRRNAQPERAGACRTVLARAGSSWSDHESELARCSVIAVCFIYFGAILHMLVV